MSLASFNIKKNMALDGRQYYDIGQFRGVLEMKVSEEIALSCDSTLWDMGRAKYKHNWSHRTIVNAIIMTNVDNDCDTRYQLRGYCSEYNNNIYTAIMYLLFVFF